MSASLALKPFTQQLNGVAPMTDRGPSEAEIQNAILLELGREPDVTLWRNNVGQSKAPICEREHLERMLSMLATFPKGVEACVSLIRSLLAERQRFTRFGLCVGSSDIIGIVGLERIEPIDTMHARRLPPRGIFLALEVKTQTGRIRPEQQQFLDLVNRRGGVGRVVRSVDDARAAINEARRR